MSNYANLWNVCHSRHYDKKILFDDWLKKYDNIVTSCKTKALDLGAGTGNDSLYLTEKCIKVIACDFSSIALDKIKANIKGVETLIIDISVPLPFEDESFDLIIADLSLHYFDNDTTIKIMKEIKRVLTKGDSLIARVNSIKDIFHGAIGGEKIENFYFVEGYEKRFFDKKDAIKYFSIIGNVLVQENIMQRYINKENDKPKDVLEIVATK